MFEHQMAALGYYHSLRAMSIDLRGFGQSDKPWDGHDYDTWVADIRAVFQTLDLREVMLVGFQMGGAVAAHYVATQEENRVTRLVLCAATLPALAASRDFPSGPRPWVFDGLMAGIRGDDAQAMRLFIENNFNTKVSEERLRFYERMADTASLRACLLGVEQMRRSDLTSELARIRIPTLILHGVHDRGAVRCRSGTAEAYRGATLIRFESSGHFLFWDEKDKMTHELLSFALATVPAGQPRPQADHS